LLACDGELILVSVRGERRLPYNGFHIGYKKTRLAPDELILSVCLPRRFSGYTSYARKVGSRNAQAISKVCLAGLGRVAGRIVEDVRIAVGSVAPLPMRLVQTERAVTGKTIDEPLVSLARKTAMAEIDPIDDIRSTAKYRAAVAGNLVAEFLRLLARADRGSHVLARWNGRSVDDAVTEILPCCGSRAWARAMAMRRPFPDAASLMAASDEVWSNLSISDWMEAFHSHPRIGESSSVGSPEPKSAAWATQEQQKVAEAGDSVRRALAKGNREYEDKFTFLFIVCAAGKSAGEILEILQRRMLNDPESELREAAEQQRQITQLRLRKWLQG
jgi:2-oxo-4-hydroxy-4-carboxy-5-ureidoimidazoline decarboxylase